MKTILLFISAVLLLNVSFQNGYKEQSGIELRSDKISAYLNCPLPPSFTEMVNKKTKQNPEVSDKEIDQDWYSAAMENLEKEEYNISYNEELGEYQSPNRASNLRFIYHKDGFTALTRDIKRETSDGKRLSNEWSIDFRLRDLGRTDNKAIINDLRSMFSSELKASGNKASIENENIRIDYTNTEEGMRQDFIINKKPAGEGKLRLTINADTKLKMTIGADEVKFKDKKGEEKMKYSSLKVWDANGRELKAYFEESYKLRVTSYENNSNDKEIRNLKLAIRKCFSIVVNDEYAAYPITIDPLSATPNWTAESNQSFANFGYSVSAAGDVNGDGYSDVIVGAPYFDYVQSNEGRVFVYHGSASGISVTYNWSAGSNQVSAYFGYSVSTAGDVNGDGYSDVIIGSYYFDNGQTDEGRAFVYHGSASGLSSAYNWSAESNQASAYFGWSVSTAGDVNGDGYSDVIVGDPYFDNVQTNEGRVFVYHGSASGLSVTYNWTAGSNQEGALFGYSVSTASDVNGDGYSDVIIGSSNFDNGQTNEGRAFVYHGSASGLSSAYNWSAESNQASAGFGFSVSTSGDVNGDGYSDVIVGACYFDNEQTNEGRAFVYHGSASGLSLSADWTAESNQADANFGISVSTAGDVNGDGYSDVIVGAHQFDNGQTDEGRAFVYYGSASGLSSIYNWSAESNQADASFGYSVSTAGDLNGDGYSDVIVGAPGFDNGQTTEGRAFVYHGSASGLPAIESWTVLDNQLNEQFGNSVTTAGDVNGDGYNDVIIGVPYYDGVSIDNGKAFLYLGSQNGLAAAPAWSAESNIDSANFGISVATAGDVNGDGYSDVVIGTNKFTGDQQNEGKVFVYYGSASGLSSVPDWNAEGNQVNCKFGNSVSTAGDVNGDGYSDVIIGANLFDNGQTDEGKVFVYHGSASGLSSSANWEYESNSANANFGHCVSTAGDVNGDGFSDIIIGAYNYSFGETSEGKVYVVRGSSTGLVNTTTLQIESNQVNTFYGWSVSSAGDVNGDGYGDVIVGARNYDNGENDEGKVYVYHGMPANPGLSVIPNFTTESNQANAFMGWSVSTAGDVNGDGYSDVLVGIKNYDDGQTDEGQVRLYFGSSAGVTLTGSWSAESNLANSYFGNSVSSAGDVNGDGYSDVIIGAHLFTSQGKVFGYYGNGVTGVRANVQQFKPGTTSVVSSGGFTGTNGQVKINIPGRSPYGRAKGKLVYEYKANGFPFSGAVITNSVSSTGSGPFTDLGNSGVQLSSELSGIPVANEYKWRARIQYDLVTNPYQKFGPWKYYQNNFPVSFGGFKPKEIPFSIKTLNLTILIQGFYDSGSDAMIPDTVWTYLRNSSSPYPVIDSSKAVVNSSGQGVFNFANALNSVNYFLDVRHRNSIETWSKTAQVFTSSQMTYNFTSADTQAFGNNLIGINTTPQKYGIYSGDQNQDGFVNLTDVVNVFNNANAFVNGYVDTDMKGDNITDLSDIVITFNNAGAFVVKVTP